MKEEFSSGGIVYKKTSKGIEVLFILDSYDKWTFPKGHINGNETKIGAAAREVSEETGIKIKDLRIKNYLGDIDYEFIDKEADKIHKTVYFYLMKLINPKAEIVPQKEDGVHDVKWVKIEDAMKVSYYKDVNNILKKVIEKFIQ